MWWKKVEQNSMETQNVRPNEIMQTQKKNKKKISDFFPLISLVLSLSLLFFLLFFSSFICVSLVPPFFLLSPLSFWLLYQAQRSLCTSLGKRWCTMISVQTCYKLATNLLQIKLGTNMVHLLNMAIPTAIYWSHWFFLHYATLYDQV